MHDTASKKKGLAWLVVACAVAAALAFGIGPLARIMPWRWEKALASALEVNDLPGRCVGSPAAQAALRRLVARLYPLYPTDYAFEVGVRVVSQKQVNAYASLGGVIVVYSGLLAKAESAEELAGVLAHEIAHVEHRHVLQGMFTRLFTSQGLALIFGGDGGVGSEASEYFLSMTFTRAEESEADASGLARLQAAHIDNAGLKRFFARLGEGASFLSDHPANAERLAMAERFDNQGSLPIMSATEWQALKRYCADASAPGP